MDFKCGTKEHQGSGISMWNHSPVIVYAQDIPNEFTREVFDEMIGMILDDIMSRCGIAMQLATTNTFANILITVRNLDGKGGVLADMELPPATRNDTSRVQRRMRIDQHEDWSIYEGNLGQKFIDCFRVVYHELLHGIGLGHSPENTLMAPTVGQHRFPSGWDLRQMESRYPKKPIPKPDKPTEGNVCKALQECLDKQDTEQLGERLGGCANILKLGCDLLKPENIDLLNRLLECAKGLDNKELVARVRYLVQGDK